MNKRAIIVGAGPAGASAAIGLRRSGFDVIVYEQRIKWAERVCGSFLNSEAVCHLKWLNVDLTGAAVGACRLTTSAGTETDVDLKGEGLAVPRYQLETALLKRVEIEGGEIQAGSRVRNARDIEADLIVAAGGRFALADPARTMGGQGWYGWNARFRGLPHHPGELSLHFYPGGYVGTLTFEDGTSNVSGLTYRTDKSPVSWGRTVEDARSKQIFLDRLLSRSERISDWKGIGPLPYSAVMKSADGILPVGDAAAVGDPFLGEGIGRALGAGAMLYDVGRSARKDFLTEYARLWKNAYERRLWFGALARTVIRNGLFYRPILQTLIGIYTRFDHHHGRLDHTTV